MANVAVVYRAYGYPGRLLSAADDGFQTPAGAFGADLVLEATEAERADVQ
jgi:hypothetical protein